MLKLFLQTFGSIAPEWTAKRVYKMISKPRVRPVREHEIPIINSAQKTRISFKGFELQLYQWGVENYRSIFLIHGWEGRASNFGSLVPILVEQGYRVISFDGPGHGESSKGSTNMLEFSDFITEMITKFRPNDLISHSFGSITTLHALNRTPDVPISKWLIVTTTFDFNEWIEELKTQFGLPGKMVKKLVELIERKVEFKSEQLNINYLGPRIEQVEQIKMIHSVDDQVISIEDSRRASVPLKAEELVEVDGLGHYRILWSDELKDLIKVWFQEKRLDRSSK